MHSLPRPDTPCHILTCPLKPGCFVTFCQWRTLYRSLARNLALFRRLLTVRMIMRPLTIHRLFGVYNAEWLLSCEVVRSLSSLDVVFIGFPVLSRSFTLPVWFTRCFNRTMTDEWLTLNSLAVCLYDIPSFIIPTACHISASESCRRVQLNRVWESQEKSGRVRRQNISLYVYILNDVFLWYWLCFVYISKCHVEVKFRKFPVLPVLHVQILI